MAAEKCVICLIGAMDRLWFHQIILFSEPSLLHLPENSKKSLAAVKTPDNSSENTFHISEQQVSPLASVVTGPKIQKCEFDTETTDHEKRPTRLNLVSSETRSQSSSPNPAQKQSRTNLGYSNYNYTHSARRLQKSMSCKSLIELELEEVKGFLDLGFVFSKENLSKPVINLIPGLQRLKSYENEENGTEESSEFATDEDYDFEDDEEKLGIMRPYLSEAWLVKKPDSPLMSLRMPRVSTAADMKKHLKCWARTVASAIQQQSR